MCKLKIYSNKAFTLIEMLIVTPIVILVIGVVMNMMIKMTGEIIAARTSTYLTSSVQSALSYIENDIRNSGAFLAKNNINLTSPQGRNNDTTDFYNASSTNGDSIILNSYGTTDNPLRSDIEYIYTKAPNACSSSSVTSNPRLMFNIVYFIKNNSLWRRVIAPSNYTYSGCKTAWQIPSCYPDISGTFCKSKDMKMIENISIDSFDVTYYDNAESTSPNTTASDPSLPYTTRQSALDQTSIINISIKSDTVAAGRNVSQAGTIKVDLSDNYADNSSAINNTYSAATPQLPIITANPAGPLKKLDNETNTSFSAGADGDTSVQWQYSSDNGSTWINVSGGTSSTLSMPSITTSLDGNLYRAVFSNSYGTAATSSARLFVGDSSWHNFGTTNEPPYYYDWANYSSSYNYGGFRKTKNGTVVLKGLLNKPTAATSNTSIARLPVGYRPSGRLIFATSAMGNTVGRVDVDADGYIKWVGGTTPGWFSIEGIEFVAGDNYRYTPTALTTFYNGWTNYGSGYTVASYIKDDAGHVITNGLVKSGTLVDHAPLVDVPYNDLPSEYLHVATYAGGYSTFGVSKLPSSAILTKGTSYNGYFSINSFYYPSSTSVTWSNLSLVNGWYQYPSGSNGYSSPQYTKSSSDGLVTLKGLITGGSKTYGSTITTLPAGYRPASRILTTTYCSASYCRIDITSTGAVLYMGTTSQTTVSLDNITFYADQ